MSRMHDKQSSKDQPNDDVKIEFTDHHLQDFKIEVEELDSFREDQIYHVVKSEVADNYCQDLENRLDEHISDYFKKELHECRFCEFRTLDQRSLEKHFEELHPSEQQYNCDICSYSFFENNELECHIASEHRYTNLETYKFEEIQSPIKIEVNCLTEDQTEHKVEVSDNCPDDPPNDVENYKINDSHNHFIEEETSELHIPSKQDVSLKEKKKFKCEQCEWSTVTARRLTYHIKKVHLKEKNHYCRICKYSTYDKDKYDRHMEERHNSDIHIEGYKCGYCDYNTYYVGKLGEHIKKVHLKEKYKCNLCSYSTIEEKKLINHQKFKHISDSSDRVHTCEHCNYRAIHAKNLSKHIRRVHLKVRNHKCSLCTYSAFASSDLKKHIKSKHRDETGVIPA